MDKKPNAYRVIFNKYKEAFTTGDKDKLNEIPDLDGSHFLEINKNNCPYLPDKKYLHFFPSKADAISYASGLADVNKDISILMFHFPSEMLETFTFQGVYETKIRNQIRGHEEKRNEYILPLELYDAKEHYTGEVDPTEFKPQTLYDPDADYYGFF